MRMQSRSASQLAETDKQTAVVQAQLNQGKVIVNRQSLRNQMSVVLKEGALCTVYWVSCNLFQHHRHNMYNTCIEQEHQNNLIACSRSKQ